MEIIGDVVDEFIITQALQLLDPCVCGGHADYVFSSNQAKSNRNAGKRKMCLQQKQTSFRWGTSWGHCGTGWGIASLVQDTLMLDDIML